MFALISTIETGSAFHLCEVSTEKFFVVEPDFYWIECPDNISTATHTFDGVNFQEIPVPTIDRLIIPIKPITGSVDSVTVI